MRRLARFVKLPAAERTLFLHALLLVGIIRLGLWLLPSRKSLEVVSGMCRHARGDAVGHSVDRLAWAVRAAARYVPLATCLTQALALQWLLVRSGHASSVHLGARKSPEGKFEAHAWIECENRVVIGGPLAQEYVPLAAWQK
jgi:hypothetical protein